MSNNCASCNELREHAPDFVQNGVTDDIAESLQNNNGLNPKETSDNCTDLNLANDCLIGQMAEEVNAYGTCDWPIYAKKFVPNVYQMLKGIINSICGLWGKISGAKAFIRYARDNGFASANDLPPVPVSGGEHFKYEFYMDANGYTPGQTIYGKKAADRDYVVMIQACVDFAEFRSVSTELTFYSSGDTRSFDVIKARQAQHPDFRMPGLPAGTYIRDFSWTSNGMVTIKKGEHIMCDFFIRDTNDPPVGNFEGTGKAGVRLHQIAMTWIPVEYIDEAEIGA